MNVFIKNIIYLLILVTPSIFVFNFTDVFEAPKLFLITQVLLFLTIFSLLGQKRLLVTKTDLILILFLIINYLSALLGSSFPTSFFGYFGNNIGSLVFLSSIIFFLVINKEIVKSIKIKELNKILTLSSVFPVIYGFIQIFNLDFFTWENNTDRIFSTFGQPNFFAIYLCVILVATYFAFVKNKSVKTFIWLLLVLFLFVKTESLSAFISICLFFVLYLLIYYKKINKKLLIFFLLIVMFVFIQPGLHNRIFMQLAGGGGTILTNDTAKIRLILWKNTLLSINNYKVFVIGNGVENFAYSFKRPSELNNTSEWKILFNKPHNLFIEEFYEIGIFALIFYIFLLFISLKNFIKNPNYFVPLLILINSFFLWIPAFMLFILYLFFYLNTGKEDKYAVNFNFVAKSVLLTTLIAFLTSVIVFSTALFFVKNNPCFSYKLVPVYQSFVAKCALQINNLSLQKDAYLINTQNKIVAEEVGNSLLKNKDIFAQEIFNNLYKSNPNDPVFMYYLGVSYEIFDNKENALKFYLKAKNSSLNFYENEEAIKRLQSN